MATATAIKALGTKIRMEGITPSTYDISLGDVTSLEVPGFSAEIIDVTHLESAGREKLAGIVDHGQIAIGINFVPGSTAHTALTGAAGQKKKFQITFADPDDVGYNFSAIVASWKPAGATPTTVQSGTLTLEITGAVTEVVIS